MFLAPLAEMPPIGRKPVYLVTLFLFVVFNFPVVYAPNITTLLVFRFLTVSASSHTIEICDPANNFQRASSAPPSSRPAAHPWPISGQDRKSHTQSASGA